MTCVDEVFGKRRVSRLARAVFTPVPASQRRCAREVNR
jgi:hypothetical protein